MVEFEVGDRFIIPDSNDSNDGRLIEVQERDRHSLCDGCFLMILPVWIEDLDIVILRDAQTTRM